MAVNNIENSSRRNAELYTNFTDFWSLNDLLHSDENPNPYGWIESPLTVDDIVSWFSIASYMATLGIFYTQSNPSRSISNNGHST